MIDKELKQKSNNFIFKKYLFSSTDISNTFSLFPSALEFIMRQGFFGVSGNGVT